MQSSRPARSRWWIALALPIAGCAPSLVGLAAAEQGGGSDTTVVNPTLEVTAPAAFVDSASLSVAVTTVPAGQPVEANLDGAGWQTIAPPWQITGLGDGEHSAVLRVRGAAQSQRTITWTTDTVAPTAPAGLTVTAGSAGRLSLSWTAGSDGGSGLADYTVSYGTATGVRNETAVAAAPATSVQLQGLSACETYYVTVHCTDRAGNDSTVTTEVSGRVNCGGDGAFTTAATSTFSSVSDVATGDFNGDGILDAALADATELRILLGGGSDGRGDGTFAAGNAYAAGAWIQDLAIADLDADGILDIVVLDSASLRVFLGQGSGGTGDGTFAAHATITTNLITPQALCVRDFNGDRIADALVGDWSGSRLLFFVGDGANGRGFGTFSYANTTTTGSAPGAIAAGDFNADGITDIAVACQQATDVLITHLGNGSDGRGDGTFAAKQTWLSGGFVGGDVLVADHNSDGIDDLIVTLTLADIVCFMAGSGSGGRGTGTFYLESVASVGEGPWGLAAGDFTGDNITDYVTCSYNEAGVTLVTAGGEHGRGDVSFTSTQVGAGGGRLFQAAVGDFDGNGSPDVLAADLDGALHVLANNGRRGVPDGGFAEAAVTGPGVAFGTTGFGVGVADFTSDKVPDVMIAGFVTPYSGGSDFVLQYLNTEVEGLGTGEMPSGQLLFLGSGPTAFAFGDFDADAIVDTAVLCSDLDRRGGGDRVDVLITDGSNGVGTGDVAGTSSTAVGSIPRGIFCGDFDADSILDLAVTDSGDDTVTILLGDGSGGRGDGTFTAQTPIAVATGPFAIVGGDFDRNGILDLAIGCVGGSGNGSLQILLGNGSNGVGTGGFTAGTPIATTGGITGLTVGDFTGDGILDLVGTQFRSGGGTSASGVILFTGNGSGGQGDGTFTAGAEVAIGGNPFALTAADFDGDRVLDLAVTDADSPAAAILCGGGSSGRGDGTFAAPVAIALDDIAVAIAHADFDSDGVLDLIAVGSDGCSLRLGTGTF